MFLFSSIRTSLFIQLFANMKPVYIRLVYVGVGVRRRSPSAAKTPVKVTVLALAPWEVQHLIEPMLFVAVQVKETRRV